MTGAQDILRPGDVLAVRLGGLASELIRIGEEMAGKPGLDNHIAVMHHWLNGTPWGLQGEPGGVGWVDLRAYLASGFTVNNCGQPGRDDAGRAAVAALAERMIGTAYDWCSITDDTLRAFHMHDLFSQTLNGTVPGHLVCSSYAAFLYERQGWERPAVTDRDTEPGDWTAFALEHGWSVTIVPSLQPHARGSGCCT
jgi:hypothetical protein